MGNMTDAPARLPPLFVKRHVGFQLNQKTGLPEPKVVTYQIGHGQQLAAKRLAPVVAANKATAMASPQDGISRQVERRLRRKAANAAASAARRQVIKDRRKKKAA